MFDVRISAGGNPYGGSHQPGSEARFTTGSIVSSRSKEGKAAGAFIKAIDGMDFDCDLFAHTVLAHTEGNMQARVLDVFRAFNDALVMQYDNGIITNATVKAKRVDDALIRYGKTA